MKTTLYTCPSLFKFCSPPPWSFYCLVYFAECVITPPLICVILLNDVMDLGALILVVPCYVFYARMHQIYWRFDMDHMVFAITLFWYHKHRQTYTGHRGINIIRQTYFKNKQDLPKVKVYFWFYDQLDTRWWENRLKWMRGMFKSGLYRLAFRLMMGDRVGFSGRTI